MTGLSKVVVAVKSVSKSVEKLSVVKLSAKGCRSPSLGTRVTPPCGHHELLGTTRERMSCDWTATFAARTSEIMPQLKSGGPDSTLGTYHAWRGGEAERWVSRPNSGLSFITYIDGCNSKTVAGMLHLDRDLWHTYLQARVTTTTAFQAGNFFAHFI